MPELIAQLAWEEEVGNSLVVREPVGVVGAITPWNYPLHQIACKVAPALAAGCTVVLKPSSEVAPLNAFVLAEVIDAVGLPAGVFNLVTGHRPGRRRGDRRPPATSTWSRSPARRAPDGACREIAAPGGQARSRSSSAASRANVILDDADLQTRGHRRRGEVLPELRADVQRADAHARARASASPRSRRSRPRPPRRFTPGDPFAATTTSRAARLGRAARARARLHREGRRARARRSSPAAPSRPDGLERGLLRARRRCSRTSRPT